MAQKVRTRRIDAKPDEIWALLADFGSLADWVPSVSHTTLTTGGDVGVGTTRRVQAGRIVLLEQIVDFEPGETLAYRIDGLPRVVRHAENRWRLTEVDGGTEVSITSTVDTGSRPPRRAIAGLVVAVQAKVSDRLLAGLDAHLRGQRDA